MCDARACGEGSCPRQLSSTVRNSCGIVYRSLNYVPQTNDIKSASPCHDMNPSLGHKKFRDKQGGIRSRSHRALWRRRMNVPQVDRDGREGCDGLVERRPDADVNVADLLLVHSSHAPEVQHLLELLGGLKQGSDCSWYVRPPLLL